MKKTILIVDDVAAIRSTVKSGFESDNGGFQIRGEAEDGLDAIKKARQLKPDLIILDFAMPLLNGIRVPPCSAAKCQQSH